MAINTGISTPKRGDKVILSFYYPGDITERKLIFVVKSSTSLGTARIIQKKNTIAGGSDSQLTATYDATRERTQLNVTLLPANTQNLTAKKYYYDITSEHASDSTDHLTILEGVIDLLPDVQTPSDQAVITNIVESPAGTKDGSNTIFTLTYTPAEGMLLLYVNGIYQVENVHYTIEDNVITFVEAPDPADNIIAFYTTTAGAVLSNVAETPAGDVDGSNDEFELTNTPSGNTLLLFLNGVYQVKDVDYTITGTTITFTNPPETGDIIKAHYYAE